MIRFFMSNESGLTELTAPEPGCWVHAASPSPGELMHLRESLRIPLRFLRAAIDDEESARIDHEADCTLLIVDIPIVETESNAFVYTTMPMGIILAAGCVITLASRECPVMDDFLNTRVRGFISRKTTRFVLQILGRVTTKFIAYLKQIDKAASLIDERLATAMSADDLTRMRKLKKSLVYLTASLRGNESVLARISRQHHIEKLPEDLELLEDVIIENRQAVEMCSLYRDILQSDMDALSIITASDTRHTLHNLLMILSIGLPVIAIIILLIRV